MKYPPQGEELRITKRIEKIVRRLDKGPAGHLSSYVPSTGNVCIHAGFALEGVRTNGTCRLTNVLTVYKDLQEFKRDMDSFVKRVSKASEQVDKAISEAEGLMGEFTICPKCKGGKGWKTSTEGQDCVKCHGRGII